MYRLSDSTVSENAGIEPRTVATITFDCLTLWCTTRLYLIHKPNRYTTHSSYSFLFSSKQKNIHFPGGKLVDATAATEADLQNELDKVKLTF